MLEYVDELMGEYSIEEIKADPEYFKKSCIYDMIYEDLQLNDWLYNRDNPAFYQLSINAINDDGQRIRYNAMLENILKKEFGEEEIIDYEIMMKERKKDNMSLPDELYQRISAEINNWPAWKKKAYKMQFTLVDVM